MTTNQKHPRSEWNELTVTHQWHACFFTIRRPERGNSLSPRLIADLHGALDQLVDSLSFSVESSGTENSSISSPPIALVLTASPVVSTTAKSPSRTWIAGGDLKELAKLKSAADGAQFAASASHFLDRLDQLPLPVIVAIDGDAIGGGAEFAIAGDIRMATATSRLLWKQIRVGLATGFGSAKRLVDRIGVSRTQDLLFGEKTLTADQALQLGLWTDVVDDDKQLENAIHQRLNSLRSASKEALAGQKQMFWSATHSHPGAANHAEVDIFRKIWGNPTHQSFMNQFGAKKPSSPRITLERSFYSPAGAGFGVSGSDEPSEPSEPNSATKSAVVEITFRGDFAASLVEHPTAPATATRTSTRPTSTPLTSAIFARHSFEGGEAALLDLNELPAPYAIDATLCVVACPWQKNPVSALFSSTTQSGTRFLDERHLRHHRLFFVACMGWYTEHGEKKWLDGPLLHWTRAKGLLSYMPSGGPARLVLPRDLPRDLIKGPSAHADALQIPINADTSLSELLEQAAALEGSEAERAHRALVAALGSMVYSEPENISEKHEGAPSPTPRSAQLLLGQETLKEALALVLVRQWQPTFDLAVRRTQKDAPMHPGFKRFLENAGIRRLDSGPGLAVEALTPFIPDETVKDLVQVINSISEILPKSLIS